MSSSICISLYKRMKHLIFNCQKHNFLVRFQVPRPILKKELEAKWKKVKGQNESGLETNEHPNPLLSCYNHYYYANKKKCSSFTIGSNPLG